MRTIVNVGDLGPTEERWPDNEVYDMERLRRPARCWPRSCGPGAPPSTTPPATGASALLLRELGKHCAIGSPIIVDGQLWGEFYATRSRGDQDFGSLDMSYMEALMAILGGAISRSLREESLERWPTATR